MLLKKKIITILFMGIIISLSSCNENSDELKSSKSKVTEQAKGETTVATKAYKEIDFLESINVKNMRGLYPSYDIYMTSSEYDDIFLDSGGLNWNLYEYSVICSPDVMNITINFPVNNNLAKSAIEKAGVVSINNTKEISYNISELDSLLFKEDQYTEKIDDIISDHINSYFSEIGVDFNIVKKYLYVYNDESELNRTRIYHESNDMFSDTYSNEISLIEYDGSYGLKTICYSPSSDKYYFVPVVLRLKNNELVDYYIGYSVDDNVYAKNSEEECFDYLEGRYFNELRNEGKLIEYVK